MLHPKIKVGAVLSTKSDYKVRVICTDRPGTHPVVAHSVCPPYFVEAYTGQGKVMASGAYSSGDLDLGPTKLWWYRARAGNDAYLFFDSVEMAKQTALSGEPILTATLDEGRE